MKTILENEKILESIKAGKLNGITEIKLQEVVLHAVNNNIFSIDIANKILESFYLIPDQEEFIEIDSFEDVSYYKMDGKEYYNNIIKLEDYDKVESITIAFSDKKWLPSGVRNLKNLKEINIKDPIWLDNLPERLTELESLESFTYSNSDTSSMIIKNMDVLYRIKLKYLRITWLRRCLDFLSRMESLETLDISESLIEINISELIKLKKLKEFNINWFRGKIYIEDMSNNNWKPKKKELYDKKIKQEFEEWKKWVNIIK